MTTVWIVMSVLLAAFPADPVDIRELDVHPLALVAVDDFERAAFVVRDADGSLRLIEWPSTHRYRSTAWRGPRPPNVVAIIHTHPKRMPLPSDDDIRTAKRLNMPVMALTARSLCAATAAGAVRCTTMISGGGTQ